MATALKLDLADAKRAISILELQGYVKPAEASEWMTTISGEEVSGSKTPRYTPELVEKSLTHVRKRIAEINRDSKATYKITEAVAFGDFLGDRSRVQSAEVGIQLVRRGQDNADSGSAKESGARREFLKRMLGKSGVLQVRPYEEWMSERTHRNLI